MKTLREYLDQLDEISRRDFLKTAGAAVTGAALGQAKGQTVGAGENESLYATNQAINQWRRLSRDNQSVTQSLYDNLHRRIFQFYQLSGGKNFIESTNNALADSLDIIVPEFQQIERVLEKNKEEGRLGKALLARALNLQDLSKAEQLKIIGSMQTVNLVPTANRFLEVYTQSLNRSLEQINQQKPQRAAGSAASSEPAPVAPTRASGLDLSDFESRLLDNGLVLYVYASRQNHESKSAIKAALNRLAQRTGAAERINRRLREISADPGRYGASTRPDQYFQQVNQIIKNIDELGAR